MVNLTSFFYFYRKNWSEAWKRTAETGYHLKTFATFPDNAESLFAELGLAGKLLDNAA